MKSRDSKRYLYTPVHSSIVHDSQEGETTKISMNNNIWYVPKMEYISLKKE